MGNMQLIGMKAMVNDIDFLLDWHLKYNHYPAVHSSFIPVAKEAIERASDEDWDYEIKMPNDKILSVAKIIEGLHLDEFLPDPEENDLYMDEAEGYVSREDYR